MARPRLPKLRGNAAASAPPVASTSYKAQGVAAPPANDQEIGSSRGVSLPELVPELASSYQRAITYNKMMNDAGVDVSIRAGKTPVLGADYYIDPYDDLPINVEIGQFIEDNLFGGGGQPFLASIDDIMTMYEDGYSLLEKVVENRPWTPPGQGKNTKNYTMLKELAIRPATTIKNIEYDNNGHVVKITQSALQADNQTQDKDLAVDKLLIFTFNRKGGDISGKSLLRTAYPHWYYKTHLYKIDAIQKQRHALGIPHGELLAGWNAQDRETLRVLLRNIAANEEQFIITTPTVNVKFEEVQGQLVNVLDSAAHHNSMILLNVMVQFLNLGMGGTGGGSGGGRATSGSQQDMFMKSLRYVANYVCDVINKNLIPELVVWNYPTRSFPKLKVRNIGETRDLQMLGAALANLFAQEALTTDVDTENWIREIFDMPGKNLSAAQVPSNKPTPQATNGKAQSPPPVVGSQKGAVQQQPGQAGNTGKPPNAFQ